MDRTQDSAKVPKAITTFEGILEGFGSGVDLSKQISIRSRELVDGILGPEPKPETAPDKIQEANTLAEKLEQQAKSFRVSLNEISDQLTRLEGSL